jgi:hypothetical protein
MLLVCPFFVVVLGFFYTFPLSVSLPPRDEDVGDDDNALPPSTRSHARTAMTTHPTLLLSAPSFRSLSPSLAENSSAWGRRRQEHTTERGQRRRQKLYRWGNRRWGQQCRPSRGPTWPPYTFNSNFYLLSVARMFLLMGQHLIRTQALPLLLFCKPAIFCIIQLLNCFFKGNCELK